MQALLTECAPCSAQADWRCCRSAAGGGAGSSLVETGWQTDRGRDGKLGSDVLITGLVPELDKQELPKEAE